MLSVSDSPDLCLITGGKAALLNPLPPQVSLRHHLTSWHSQAASRNRNKIYFPLIFAKNLKRLTKQIHKWVCKLNNSEFAFQEHEISQRLQTLGDKSQSLSNWARLHQIWKENSTAKYVQNFLARQNPLFLWEGWTCEWDQHKTFLSMACAPPISCWCNNVILCTLSSL